MVTQSLRERLKARRRAAIQRTALELFAERGYDATTIVDIAAEAEVAPRTVTLYFPAKADLALANTNAAADRLKAAFTARAPDETILDVLDRWLLAEGTTFDPDTVRLVAAMFTANPALRAMHNAVITQAIDVSVRAMVDAPGVEMDQFLIDVISGAVAGVVHAYLGAILTGNDVKTTHDTAMGFLRAGINAVIPRSIPPPAHNHSRTTPESPACPEASDFSTQHAEQAAGRVSFS